MMMLSDQMTNAVKNDGLGGSFVYAVAGGGRDDDCGKCYQVQLLDAERAWRSDFPFLVVQVVNSGFDVMEGQLDIFMGGGGFGYFTACNADCRDHACQGGPCRQAMYDGDFQRWVNAEYNDPNLCYSGGIKWLDRKNRSDELYQLCRGLSGFAVDQKANTTTESCFRTNTGLFHQNFVSSRYTRVRCPLGLCRQTGLSRADDDMYPMPSTDRILDHSCLGDRSAGRYCLTTMQDCCKMSCSWSGKVQSKNGSCVYTCGRDGNILLS